MCQFFSCIVLKDGQVRFGLTESHEAVVGALGLSDLKTDAHREWMRLECCPIDGGWHHNVDEDIVPGWWQLIETDAWARIEQLASLKRPAWEAYEAAKRQAWEAYEAAKRQAMEAYRAAERPAWEAYEAAERPAMKAFLAVERQAMEAFLAVERQAMEAYGVACCEIPGFVATI